MSACPEASLFREAEMAYALVCMSTDYDSWHGSHEAVSVELVMSHMAANAGNARRAVEAVLAELWRVGADDAVWRGRDDRWKGAAGVVTTGRREGDGEARDRLDWLFEGRFGGQSGSEV